MKILVLGGTSYDEIIHLNEFFKPTSQTIFANKSYSTTGSTGVGKAVALSKLGFEVVFISVIGRDYYGELVKNYIESNNVLFIPIYSDITERHVNIHNNKGERISIFTQIPSYTNIDINSVEQYIIDTDIVILNIKSYCKNFIKMIKKHNKPIYCDIHDYDGYNEYHNDFIEAADYIFMSSDKMNNYKDYMSTLNKKWIVCTHADKGATALKDNKFYDIEANKIEVVDTNGAGDNFFSGFLYGYLKNYEIIDSLKIGRKAAEYCIMSKEIVSDELSILNIKK